MGNTRNLKHKDLREWYQKNKTDDSTTYSNFINRVLRIGMTKEVALVYIKNWEWRKKGYTDNYGRDCTICGIYKLWSEYHNSKSGHHKKTPDCIECRNKRKRYDRDRNLTNDKKYKLKKKLEIGQKIAFTKEIYINGLPREDQWKVIGYRPKKGYLIESIHTGSQKYMTVYKRYGITKTSYQEHYKIIEEETATVQTKTDKQWIGVDI